MPRRLSSLSIVLPCRNEEPNVARTVRDAVGGARRVAADFEVVVVDDGSDDATFSVAEALRAHIPQLRVVRNTRSAGYGGAVKRGFAAARMDWVFYTDGDGQFDMSQLPDLMGALDRHDLVTGYRSPRRDSGLRTVTGRAWTALTNVLLDVSVRDVNCAFKLLPRSLLNRVELVSNGAAFSAELLSKARRLGYQVGEVPVRHRPRVAGRQSGVHPRVVLRALRELTHLVLTEAAAARTPSAQTPPSLP